MRGSETRRGRRLRLSRLDPDATSELYALRDALVTDPDAEVRSLALLRLNSHGARALLAYVRDAVLDRSMLVREAAFVALARAGDTASLPRAADACRYDRSFRVRRMALLFAASACGVHALPIVAVASRDPFWRVRVAARRAGAALGVHGDALEEASAEVELEDPDPAVVTARLARRRSQLEPRALVGLLGHSHQPLRRFAIQEIAKGGDTATLRAVTAWFVDDRVPYGPLAAEATLRRAGLRASPIATDLLADPSAQAPGVLVWALGATLEAPSWECLKACLVHEDARVRGVAVLRVPEAAPERHTLFATMVERLEDPDERTRCAAASWLLGTGSREGSEALLRLEPRRQPTALRALLVDLGARMRDVAALRSLVNDPHGGVRAAALAALSKIGALSADERRAHAEDADPWVRQAVLDAEQAPAALRDPSLHVRASALDLIADPAARTAWAETADAAREPEASLRARAAEILATGKSVEATKVLLRLARDRDLGVRSAAVDALERHRTAAHALLQRGSLGVDERIAAYTLFCHHGEIVGRGETDARALAHLALLDAVQEGCAPQHEPAARTAAVSKGPMRQIGRTGIAVQPFGLSGAHDLAFDDFALAHERGVNLFFWEPRHRELGRFLRSRRGAETVVVAGSFHADAPSIERDVQRALRALRREVLDVFLAFWTRSPARIDEVTGVLRDLARRGLIRATGLSTHDRGLACAAAERGLDVVMVRHNAAHRGAESTVFPQCSARGTGVLTFSNLCYGRMLHRTPALSARVTAPECYRYSLSQAGVHACIAAPRRHVELIENLAVLENPVLGAERQAELRAHGDHVYARAKAWRGESARESGESLSDWVERPESIGADL